MRYFLVSVFLHFVFLFLFSGSFLYEPQQSSLLPLNSMMAIEIISVPKSYSERAEPRQSQKPVVDRIGKESSIREDKKKGQRKINPVQSLLPKTKPSQILESDAESPAAEVSLGGRDQTLSYAEELKIYLERNKKYPRRALRLKQSGIVLVQLKIKSNGEFGEIELVQPSSFPLLDQAALNLISRLGRFKPLPAGLGSSTNFTIPVAYVLRGGG